MAMEPGRVRFPITETIIEEYRPSALNGGLYLITQLDDVRFCAAPYRLKMVFLKDCKTLEDAESLIETLGSPDFRELCKSCKARTNYFARTEGKGPPQFGAIIEEKRPDFFNDFSYTIRKVSPNGASACYRLKLVLYKNFEALAEARLFVRRYFRCRKTYPCATQCSEPIQSHKSTTSIEILA